MTENTPRPSQQPGFELNVVLIRSLYDSNIGASSRAMDNMGGNRLILIAPQCEITYSAQQAAASGQDALQNRTTYQNFQEFYAKEPEGIYIAFTARDGKGRQVQDFSETLNHIKTTDPRFQKTHYRPVKVYLIFGPEDWGLSAEDIESVNFCCNIPTFGKNWSLNLAQAVLLAQYTLRLQWGGEKTVLEGSHTAKLAKPNTQTEEVLRVWLTEMGFDLSKRKVNVFNVIRRMLLQNLPTKKELSMLEIVLNQSVRKLREYNEMRRLLNKGTGPDKE